MSTSQLFVDDSLAVVLNRRLMARERAKVTAIHWGQAFDLAFVASFVGRASFNDIVTAFPLPTHL